MESLTARFTQLQSQTREAMGEVSAALLKVEAVSAAASSLNARADYASGRRQLSGALAKLDQVQQGWRQFAAQLSLTDPLSDCDYSQKEPLKEAATQTIRSFPGLDAALSARLEKVDAALERGDQARAIADQLVGEKLVVDAQDFTLNRTTAVTADSLQERVLLSPQLNPEGQARLTAFKDVLSPSHRSLLDISRDPVSSANLALALKGITPVWPRPVEQPTEEYPSDEELDIDALLAPDAPMTEHERHALLRDDCSFQLQQLVEAVELLQSEDPTDPTDAALAYQTLAAARQLGPELDKLPTQMANDLKNLYNLFLPKVDSLMGQLNGVISGRLSALGSNVDAAVATAHAHYSTLADPSKWAQATDLSVQTPAMALQILEWQDEVEEELETVEELVALLPWMAQGKHAASIKAIRAAAEQKVPLSEEQVSYCLRAYSQVSQQLPVGLPANQTIVKALFDHTEGEVKALADEAEALSTLLMNPSQWKHHPEIPAQVALVSAQLRQMHKRLGTEVFADCTANFPLARKLQSLSATLTTDSLSPDQMQVALSYYNEAMEDMSRLEDAAWNLRLASELYAQPEEVVTQD